MTPKLKGFEFIRRLGEESGFGEVWLARDVNLQKERAVKLLPRDRYTQENIEMLIDEARKMAQLPKHRNRVQVHSLFPGITNCFLVMEYVEGGALSKQTSRQAPMIWGRAARYVAGVAEALLEIHANGMLHRDIKPANIFLDTEHDEALLGDFGLACLADRAITRAGTRGYIAPEVPTGRASVKSDVYSLAATLFHLVTGSPPSTADPPANSTHWAQLPIEMQQVILAGMDPELDKRVDLATFLSMLREARWKALTEQVLHSPECLRSQVKLQASVTAAKAHDPTTFYALVEKNRWPVRLETGDFVKIEASANADGYHTVLLLGASGNLEVALPRATALNNRFAASQRHSLIIKLTPPEGTERILILWSRKDVKQTSRQWCQWVETVGLGTTEEDKSDIQRHIRDIEIVGSKAGSPPQGNWRALVIAVPHGPPS